MPWLDTTNKSLTLIIKVLIIIAFVAFGAWFLISILGNTLLADNPPEIPETKYRFLIKNTGEYIYTNDYSASGEYLEDICYILHGYYELKDNKYRWHEKDLMICQEYFGPIEVSRK